MDSSNKCYSSSQNGVKRNNCCQDAQSEPLSVEELPQNGRPPRRPREGWAWAQWTRAGGGRRAPPRVALSQVTVVLSLSLLKRRDCPELVRIWVENSVRSPSSEHGVWPGRVPRPLACVRGGDQGGKERGLLESHTSHFRQTLHDEFGLMK